MKEVTADGICFLRSVKLPRRAHAAGAVHRDALHGKQRRHGKKQLRLLPPCGRPAGQRAPERSVVIGSGLVHGGLLARIFSIVTHRAPQEKGRSALPCAKKQTDTEMSVCLLVF